MVLTSATATSLLHYNKMQKMTNVAVTWHSLLIKTPKNCTSCNPFFPLIIPFFPFLSFFFFSFFTLQCSRKNILTSRSNSWSRSYNFYVGFLCQCFTLFEVLDYLSFCCKLKMADFFVSQEGEPSCESFSTKTKVRSRKNLLSIARTIAPMIMIAHCSTSVKITAIRPPSKEDFG